MKIRTVISEAESALNILASVAFIKYNRRISLDKSSLGHFVISDLLSSGRLAGLAVRRGW